MLLFVKFPQSFPSFFLVLCLSCCLFKLPICHFPTSPCSRHVGLNGTDEPTKMVYVADTSCNPQCWRATARFPLNYPFHKPLILHSSLNLFVSFFPLIKFCPDQLSLKWQVELFRSLTVRPNLVPYDPAWQVWSLFGYVLRTEEVCYQSRLAKIQLF